MNDKTPGSLSDLRAWLQNKLAEFSSIKGIEKAIGQFRGGYEAFSAEKTTFYASEIRILVTAKEAAVPEMCAALRKLREELKELGYSCPDAPTDPQTLLDNQGQDKAGFYGSLLCATTGEIRINREDTQEENLIQKIIRDIRNR